MTTSAAELVVVGGRHGYNPSRHLAIYIDGDVTNLNLDNLQPASRKGYAERITNSLRATPAEEELRPVRHDPLPGI
ncbi:hypothetical protein V8B55DRAFT_1437912 [Mucor lusitanicus]